MKDLRGIGIPWSEIQELEIHPFDECWNGMEMSQRVKEEARMIGDLGSLWKSGGLYVCRNQRFDTGLRCSSVSVIRSSRGKEENVMEWLRRVFKIKFQGYSEEFEYKRHE